jgi:hypothetical protein
LANFDRRWYLTAVLSLPFRWPLKFLPGNTADDTWLRWFLREIETHYGKAKLSFSIATLSGTSVTAAIGLSKPP